MPLVEKQLTPQRIDFRGSLSSTEIDRLARDEVLRVVQTSEPVERKTLRLLNDELFTRRPDLEFRLYGFYSIDCDLSCLSQLTNVQFLATDCLRAASGVEAIGDIPRLRGLSIGIWSLEDFGFLNSVSDEVESLFLGATKSKRPDLASVSRFTKLKRVSLEGQRKNIEVLSDLRDIEDVTLRSITVPDLKFLVPLKSLWSLDLKLGGTKNLSALEGMERLKYLELWLVKGLSDVSVVSTLTGIQHLFMQALARVERLPNLSALKKLRRMSLDTMKGLHDVSSLRHAPVLTDYIHVAASNLQPADYIPLLQNPSVRKVRIGFGSEKKNDTFKAMLAEHGKEWADFERFKFSD